MFDPKQVDETHDDEDIDDDDRLLCRACEALITRGRWRIAVNQDHDHTVFNPAGRLFRIGCFRDAPGVGDASDPSAEFTWFEGYDWRIAVCRGCGVHVGWRFEGAEVPPVFFGLITKKLKAA